MIWSAQIALAFLGVAGIALVWRKPLARWIRAKRYFTGRKLGASKRVTKNPPKSDGLIWGEGTVPWSSATRHFAIAGTTGSGKTHIQRLLLKRPLLSLREGSDSRVLVYDAKGDTVPYLKRIGVTAPVYSLNPFEARTSFPEAVGWDAGKDITCPTLALNFSAAIVPEQGGGNNLFFTNASRHIVAAILKSLIRHNTGAWNFSDFVAIALNRELTKQILSRDPAGKRDLDRYLPDSRTGDDVYATLCTHVGYFEPIAALWKKTTKHDDLEVMRNT